MTAVQSPLECKDPEDSGWMFNDRQQSPCQVLSSSIQLYEPNFGLTWLDLAFQCPDPTPGTVTQRNSTLSDLCCSSITFSLFSACWSCQFDQPIAGLVRTTWDDFSTNCPSYITPTGESLNGLIGVYPIEVQTTLDAAAIQIPSWARLPTQNNSTWDETAARLQAEPIYSGSSKLSKGAIAGITLGSFVFLCGLILILTVLCIRRRRHAKLQFYHGYIGIFRPKQKAVNPKEKKAKNQPPPMQGGSRLLDTTGRAGLALDEELASPASAKGYHDPRRNKTPNLETHEGGLPTLEAGHVSDQPSNEGVAGRLRKSLGRSIALVPKLGRSSQSEDLRGLQPADKNNRYTHPMSSHEAAPAPPFPFSVPLPDPQVCVPTFQFCPPLASLPSASVPSCPSQPSHLRTHNSAPILPSEEPTPLTEEALRAARVAQEGPLFVPASIAQWRKTATGIPPSDELAFDHSRRSGIEPLVKTVSIERARVSRDDDRGHPKRTDSLSRRPLILHEAPISGAGANRRMQKRKNLPPVPVAEAEFTRRDDNPSTALSSTDVIRSLAPMPTRLEPPATSPFRVHASTSTSQFLPAPIARKVAPKSDFSTKATIGAGKEEEELSQVTAEIQNISSRATNASGGNPRGKIRGRKPREEARINLMNTSSTNIRSDESRTPSPKIAPSAEWFDLFRRGTVPPSFTSESPFGFIRDPGMSAAATEKGDLIRNNTAPTEPSRQLNDLPELPKPVSEIQQQQQFPLSSSFAPVSSSFPSTAFYNPSIAAAYSPSSDTLLHSSQVSNQPLIVSHPIAPVASVTTEQRGKPVSLSRSVPAPVGARPIRMLPQIPPGARPCDES